MSTLAIWDRPHMPATTDHEREIAAAEARGYDRATRDAVALLRSNAGGIETIDGFPCAKQIARSLCEMAEGLERREHVGAEAGDET